MDIRRLLLLVVIGLLAAYAWHRLDLRGGRRVPETFTPAEAPKFNLDDVKVLAAIDAEYSKLINSVVPSVVSITSSRRFLQAAPRTLEDVIRGRQRAQWAQSTSLGSGVIVSKEGHILTNHHVISGMSEIRVQLTDGRNVAAKLIGSDAATDIAVLRVDAGDVIPLAFANSDEIRVGQQVFAVGNPYGLEESVSRGIVSAKGRRTASDSDVEFIQHDAAVNQGNSGGPLLNIRGEILGINSQIYSRTGGWQGISFAIPANTARDVMQGILERGRLVRPYLGVDVEDHNRNIALQLGLPETPGAVITLTVPGSPAANAGIRPGDLVLSFNGTRITNARQLRRLIADSKIGAEVELEIYRGNTHGRLSMTVAETPPGLITEPSLR